MNNENQQLKYVNSYATSHSRDYYRGKSFHFSGNWVAGAHYISDDYNIDFVVHGQVLLACAKSHISSEYNEPVEFIRDKRGTITGVISSYWDFVIAGIAGNNPALRINSNGYLEICNESNLPDNEQVWVTTSFGNFLSKNGGTVNGDIDLQNHRITNVANPINPKDIVNKQYVDNKCILIGESEFNELVDKDDSKIYLIYNGNQIIKLYAFGNLYYFAQ